MWEFAEYQSLVLLPGVFAVIGDQCCFGGQRRKGAKRVTNAPWFRQLGA